MRNSIDHNFMWISVENARAVCAWRAPSSPLDAEEGVAFLGFSAVEGIRWGGHFHGVAFQVRKPIPSCVVALFYMTKSTTFTVKS